MIISHRVNSSEALMKVPTNHGVEVDLRLFNGELILSHDPFIPGEKFEKWLDGYRHGTLILNVKEDGLEVLITELLEKKSITDYFFLDQPFPTLRKSAIAKYPTSVRLSEYENPINLKDLNIEWVWLDSFTGDWSYLKKHRNWILEGKLKLCIVSPELQGRNIIDEPQLILRTLAEEGLVISAVCTKNSNIWEKLLL
jgi:hypothetical protein